MKKILLIAACIQLLNATTSAQNLKDAVSYLPSQANGILIMNNIQHRSVVKWEVTIQEAVYNEETGQSAYQNVKRIVVENGYYLKIDKTFLTNKYSFMVKGLDVTDKEIVTQASGMNGIPWNQKCSWWCIGKTYAYGLDLWVHPNNGSSRVKMAEAPAPTDAPYHYEWVSEAEWPNFIQTRNPAYYGVAAFDPNHPGNAGKIIYRTGVPQNEYELDAENTPVYGNFYGIRKYYGPWKDEYDFCVSDDLTGGEENCVQSFGWAKGMVNQGAGIALPLTCNGNSGGDYDTNTPATDAAASQNFQPCLDFYANGWTPGDDNDGVLTVDEYGNIVQMINYLEDCTAGYQTGGTVSWPQDILNVTFQPYDNGTLPNTPIVFKRTDLINASGNVVSGSYTLPKGLIHIGIQYNDGSYGRAFAINKADVTTNINQAKFLKAVIAPSPVQGNSFTLNLKSGANLSFTYTLYDSYGNQLFTKAYTTTKNQSLSDLIDVTGGIPSGLLFNKFTFSDGSQMNINSLK